MIRQTLETSNGLTCTKKKLEMMLGTGLISLTKYWLPIQNFLGTQRVQIEDAFKELNHLKLS